MIETGYRERIHRCEAEIKHVNQRLTLMSGLRLALFLASVYAFYSAYQFELSWTVYLGLVLLAAFVWAVKQAKRLQEQRAQFKSIKTINEKEIRALQTPWVYADVGSQFEQPEHPYSNDLDLFGERSVYQWLNRTATFLGKQEMASALNQQCLDKTTLIDRQQAVKELAPRIDFRQAIQAAAQNQEIDAHGFEQFSKWVREADEVFTRSYWRWLLWVLPLFPLSGLVLWMVDVLNLIQFALVFFIALSITGLFIKRVQYHYSQASASLDNMRSYQNLFHLIATEELQSKRCVELKSAIVKEKGGAAALQEFNKWMERFENRNNILLGVVLNGLFFWDLHCVWRLEQWKRVHRETFSSWFGSIGSMEMLCSLANLQYNHPEWTFPTFNAKKQLEAVELGHPFIPKEERVNNSIELNDVGHFKIVTGANMAGKSTFLRAVGVNLVLACMGAPVCAKSFNFEPIQLFTSMRTEDSLQQHASYFYAELHRLEQLMNLLKQSKAVFVILDEILKGTNSADKASGSKAFLKQLTQFSTQGIIATHDLSLCDLQEELPEKIENLNFEVTFANDELHFDYRLRKGVCQNMNATFLMRKMGIIPKGDS